MAGNNEVIWDDDEASPGTADGAVWDDEPTPAFTPGNGKAYDPRTDLTHTLSNFKSIGPPEKGNTTGRLAPDEPAWDPVKQKPSISFMHALLRRYGAGATSSLGDELGGVAAAAQFDNTPGQMLRLPDGSVVPMSTPLERYQGGRDLNRQLDTAAQEKLGAWGLVPEAAGALTSAVVANPLFKAVGAKVLPTVAPGLANMSKARQLANTVGAEALLPSAIQAAGSSTADLSRGEVGGFLGDTAAGTTFNTGVAGLGAGTVGGMSKAAESSGFKDWIRRKAQGAAEPLRNARDNLFFQALGTSKNAMRGLEHADVTDDVAEQAFRENLVPFLGSPERIAEKAAASKQAGLNQYMTAAKEASDAATPEQLINVLDVNDQARGLVSKYDKPNIAGVGSKLEALMNANQYPTAKVGMDRLKAEVADAAATHPEYGRALSKSEVDALGSRLDDILGTQASPKATAPKDIATAVEQQVIDPSFTAKARAAQSSPSAAGTTTGGIDRAFIERIKAAATNGVKTPTAFDLHTNPAERAKSAITEALKGAEVSPSDLTTRQMLSHVDDLWAKSNGDLNAFAASLQDTLDSLSMSRVGGGNVDTSQVLPAHVVNALRKGVASLQDGSHARVRFDDFEIVNKQPLDKLVNWSKEEGIDREAVKGLRTHYKAANETAIDAVNPELGQAFREGKKTYGNAAAIETLAREKALSDKVASPVGLRDLLVGAGTGAGAGTAALGPFGALPGMAAGALGSRAVRKYGSAAAANTLNAGVKGLEGFAEKGVDYEGLARALGTAGRPASQDEVERFVEWLRSQSR